jgi:hypothetical protein
VNEDKEFDRNTLKYIVVALTVIVALYGVAAAIISLGGY